MTDEPAREEGREPIELSLSPSGNAEVVPTEQRPAPRPWPGYLAVGCGLLATFANAPLFVPLGLVFTIVAFVKKQWLWAWGGLAANILGILTSPTLLVLLGLGGLLAYFGL